MSKAYEIGFHAKQYKAAQALNIEQFKLIGLIRNSCYFKGHHSRYPHI